MVKDSGYEKIAAFPPMQRYLLPCSCSCRIPVAAGQAGGTVRCPDCGADCEVPRLGALVRLERERAESAAVVRAGWGVAQACLLAGLVTALVAAAAAGWLRVRQVNVVAPDERGIRAAAAAAAADTIHQSWLVFEHQGIARPPYGEELRRLQQAQSLATLETGAWIVAAAGGAAAAAAFIAARSSR